METIQRTWNYLSADEELANQISQETGVSGFIARTLINRGINNTEEAWKFLYADEKNLEEPFLLKDMERSVERIFFAVKKRQKIAVYGDYDVDGITSCVILYKILKDLGADVLYYIPDRHSEGYGLNAEALNNLITQGVGLVITVDCGITSIEEVKGTLAKLDVIITDHHQPGEELPPAFAIINPKQKECSYPDKNLAGVGVAFKLCQALHMKAADGGLLGVNLNYLDLVAIGTIADIVPLLGENRILVKLGLEQLKETSNTGLKELMAVSSLSCGEIDSRAVGYIIAPRLNAAGRMNHASLAVELLLTEDVAEAHRLAKMLHEENNARQLAEKNILAKAEEELKSVDLEKTKVLVLAGAGWHLGVLGIVASRLTEKYYRPVVMISVDGGIGKASCRSIASFDIYAALKKCGEFLVQFGGHRQAAGFSINEDKIDAFREMLNKVALEELTPDDYIPVLNIDACLPLNEINPDFMNQMACLKPHGEGNPSPVFASFDLSISDIRAIGQHSQHLKLKVKKENASSSSGVFEVVAWNFGSLAKSFRLRENVDIVFYPKYNEWQGNVNIQLTACDIRLKLDSIRTKANGSDIFQPPAQVSSASKSYNIISREILGKIYLLLKKDFCRQNLSFRATPDIIADRLYDRTEIIISPQEIDKALTIFKELNLLWYQSLAEWYHVYMMPAPSEKLNLIQSPTYRLHMARIEEEKLRDGG